MHSTTSVKDNDGSKRGVAGWLAVAVQTAVKWFLSAVTMLTSFLVTVAVIGFVAFKAFELVQRHQAVTGDKLK